MRVSHSDPLIAAVSMAKKRKFDENDARGNDDDRMEPELASNESKNENMLALLAKAAKYALIEFPPYSLTFLTGPFLRNRLSLLL